ncbi:VOC family protein [Nocardia callitridis]|uniref:VOC family protein n=1 Tax=Nocardia callitridis TaxID=648753 RepID=A0ABP9KN53_9NOCA
MKAADQFHLGIVADDLEATKASLAAVLGYEWGAEVGGPVAVTLPTGDTTLDIRCVYSLTVPRLEIVRSIPDTMWSPATSPGFGIHHVGFWSDDVAADIAHLSAESYVVEVVRTISGRPFFAFLVGERGFRIEVVDRAAREGLRRCWTAPESREQQEIHG